MMGIARLNPSYVSWDGASVVLAEINPSYVSIVDVLIAVVLCVPSTTSQAARCLLRDKSLGPSRVLFSLEKYQAGFAGGGGRLRRHWGVGRFRILDPVGLYELPVLDLRSCKPYRDRCCRLG